MHFSRWVIKIEAYYGINLAQTWAIFSMYKAINNGKLYQSKLLLLKDLETLHQTVVLLSS